MTWHGTVIKMVSFIASLGTEGSDNKISTPNPTSKKVFQFPALQ